VHQCCGNPLEPQVPTRRIANVRWSGADLAALLDDVGVDDEARYLWSRGLEHGTFAGVPCDGYTKDLPLHRLREGDVLIAYELNGEPLPPEHGFPARLVVPGYYGTNNVKWLSRLTLAKTRAGGPFVTRWYNDVVEHPTGHPRCNPVWAIAPASVIVSPAPDQSFALGSAIEIWGWAWSDGAATALAVSFDTGVRWTSARLDPPSGRSWQRFTTTWVPKAPGRYEIAACAQAGDGRKQPSIGARNAIHRVAVELV
jgi:sulfane dehydrogenase subunit SoxC